MWFRLPPGLLMKTKFKYKDKIYYPKNLEKKLKQLGITINDIEIIEEESKESKFKWEYEGIKEWRYYKHPDSNIIHCCLIDIGTNPTKEELFKKCIDGNVFTIEYVNELCIITLK